MALKIGFIGAGNIGAMHIKYVCAMPGVKIAAICDSDREKTVETAKKYGAKAYYDYEKMFEEEKLDACFICVPPFAHSGMELSAARRGIHLFMEKPVHIDIKKAGLIEKEIKKNGIITSVGYVFRYLDITDIARKILSGRKIALLDGKFLAPAPQSQWWGLKNKSGGQIVEQSTHIVDLARYFAGDVEAVYASGFRSLPQRRNFDVEVSSVVNLYFKNGVIGAVASSCLYPECVQELEVVTEGMGVKIHTLNKLIINSCKGKKETISKVDGYLEEVRVFINAVKSGDRSKIKSDYSDALKTLAVTVAANTSIQTRKIIYL